MARPPGERSASGVAAGSAATLLLMPLDFMKTAMQAHGWWVNEGGGRTRLRLLDVVRPTLQQKGLRPFFSGGWPAMWASGIAWGGYMYAFDFFKQSARQISGQQVLPAWQTAVCACLGGAVQSLVTHPLFMIKTRTQLQNRPGAESALPNAAPYRGTTDAIFRIMREEGTLGLWRGYSASLLLTIHGSVQFTAFEELNHLLLAHKKESAHLADPGAPLHAVSLNAWEVSVSAALSKTLAGTLTYPLTLIKTRLQDRRNAAFLGPVSYHGMWDTTVKIVQHEGWTGLYKGLMPSLARSLPLNTITLVLFQNVFLPLFTIVR